MLGLLLTSGISLAACGFGLRKVDDTRFASWGVKRVFIPAIENRSQMAWIDPMIRSEWLKRLGTGGAVTVTPSIESADAKLLIRITEATRGGLAPTSAEALIPQGTVRPGAHFHTMYQAHLVMQVDLIRVRAIPASRVPTEPEQSPAPPTSPQTPPSSTPESLPPSPAGTMLFTGTAARDLPFPANTRVSYFGTTSALINQTETERAMVEIAEQMVLDLYFQMKDAF